LLRSGKPLDGENENTIVNMIKSDDAKQELLEQPEVIEIPCNEQAVNLAYPIALQSYETSQKRWDAIDTKIQTLIVLATTLTAAVPVVTANRGLSFKSPLALLALASFVVGTVLAIYARQSGMLIILQPSVFYDKWLDLSEKQFKAELVFFAGEHCEKNLRAISRKARFSDFAALAYLVEIIFFASWALRLI
jgi:uncharacterized integral membrane protein